MALFFLPLFLIYPPPMPLGSHGMSLGLSSIPVFPYPFFCIYKACFLRFYAMVLCVFLSPLLMPCAPCPPSRYTFSMFLFGCSIVHEHPFFLRPTADDQFHWPPLEISLFTFRARQFPRMLFPSSILDISAFFSPPVPSADQHPSSQLSALKLLPVWPACLCFFSVFKPFFRV